MGKGKRGGKERRRVESGSRSKTRGRVPGKEDKKEPVKESEGTSRGIGEAEQCPSHRNRSGEQSQ